ncbi:two-component system response regulator MprA [Deinococcus metalli]|uniref:DNA-binding response regulator n=1 Tax=Deinococcus metalli TaxID=1141878 RepID=A0A7W8KKQ7_9DEIO|nr:response regulator transcription factor [Deinococcus metalli]MBB5378329.1 two-component system response regulator MprA [Deinococcus metalli]GHF59668.1 DNA-binding response regulator [Deinococcus metalli]
MTPPDARPAAPSLLVVEDDPGIREYLSLGFHYEGFRVRTAATGSEALAEAAREAPDVLLLDVMLPGLDGFAVLRALRERSQVPVLMLTARDGVDDRIAGLTGGADDYLVKPFHFGELVARVHALLRRAQPERSRVLSYADVTLDTDLREAARAGRALDLSPRALGLLEALLRHPERALSKSLLLDTVWGPAFLGDDNIVEVYVRQLRRALGDPDLIHTVRGVGYALRLKSA